MATERDREYRRDGRRRTCLGLNGELPCLCWCQRKIVHVAPADVVRGVTDTCGRPGCEPCQEVAA